MATLKNSWLRASIALIALLFGVFMVVKAMEKETVKADTTAPASTTYFYNGPATNPASNVMNPDHWDLAQDEDFSCGATSNIPCSLEVPADKDIEQHLDDLGNLAAVQAATSTRRN